MSFSLSQLLKASQLTRHGRLLDATRLIQRVLGHACGAPAPTAAREPQQPASRAFNPSGAQGAVGPVVDVPFRDLPTGLVNEMRFRPSPDDAEPQPRFGEADTGFADPVAAPEASRDADPAPIRPAAPVGTPPAAKAKPASFRAYRFGFEGVEYAYRLYVPQGLPAPTPAGKAGLAAVPADAALDPAPDAAPDAGLAPLTFSSTGASTASSTLPGPAQAPALIVLLHGCKQDAADFAKGTGMNALVADKNTLVLYPEQLAKANSLRCWNWFEPGHQSREAGEPGMIAALTRQVIAQYRVDPTRVYVAGLSAGGAMAAVLAGEYPDLFAAAGIHSGLPQGAARDVMSAFSAMKRGPASGGAKLKPSPARDAAKTVAGPVPLIVFHGTADTTVNPDNAGHLVKAALQAFAASDLPLSEKRLAPPESGGPDAAASESARGASRSLFIAADGTVYVESWEIDAGPHAWSGGDASGTYTDPDGPSASAAMLAFFERHRRRLH